MNSSPQTNDAAPDTATGLRQLQQMFRLFQTQMIAVLITLVIMNLSVNIYIWKQLSVVSKQANEMQQIMSRYLENDIPRMDAFLNQVRDIARTNTELSLILGKYPIQKTNPPSVTLPPEPGLPPR